MLLFVSICFSDAAYAKVVFLIRSNQEMARDEFLKLLRRMDESRVCQVIIATHSPMLAEQVRVTSPSSLRSQ
ncbi:hypothetical protein QA649_23095 [Bradyrhizobium sp. CB1717]|uniref:hypothetical protein n=1 Tax=Bradyrhizobium sp. CB1717 TaxID=3039154 RepID=UPI0024B1FB4C|nr:hypothetical protein [Bradyrhizobium sp. CB1717]WFU29119.1 hypothetical protein QA649_23095 [Bradyrhizobium sp. CB1717]